jgi:hypothetical protein
MITLKKPPSLVYQLKITLIGTPIWREFQVNGETKLVDLHKIIQTIMGWKNRHHHHYKIDQAYYGAKELNEGGGSESVEVKDEKKFKLSDLVCNEGRDFGYEYDFGDSWYHKILVVKIFPLTEDFHGTVLLSGENACPPEDCGGIPGYHELVEIFCDRSHKDYKYRADWVKKYDSKKFSKEEIQQKLQKLKK